MKTRNLFLMAFFVASQFMNAQTADYKFAVGLNVVKNEYNGDYGNGIFDFKQTMYPSAGLSLSDYLSPSFDFGLHGNYGNYGYYENVGNFFSGRKFDMSLFTHYKLNNGYILQKRSRFSPFISLGVVCASYGLNPLVDNSGTDRTLAPTIIIDGGDLIVPVGVGLKYRITDGFSIQYQYLY